MSRSHFVDGAAPEAAATEDASSHSLDPRRLAMRRRLIQRKAQREARADAAPPAPGGGVSLDERQRRRMEPIVKADLSAVRVHTGAESAQAADDLGARAFTDGNDVHFGGGEFRPGTREGDRLLAHELTHVAQAHAGIHRYTKEGAEAQVDGSEVSQPGDPNEQAADAGGDKAAEQLHPPLAGTATTKTHVNIRPGPGTQDDPIGKPLEPGVTVNVLAVNGAWLQVDANGRKGFITSSPEYVDFHPAAPPDEQKQESGGGWMESLENAGSALLSAAEDKLASLFGGGIQEPSPADKQKLAQEADPVFYSQRDNTFEGDIGSKEDVTSSIECNCTTLAMQLVTMSGGKKETVNQQTIELIRGAGGAVKDGDVEAQPEDLILRLFQARGDQYWIDTVKAHPEFFPKGFFDDPSHKGKGWHQILECLQWTAKEYSAVGETKSDMIMKNDDGTIDDHIMRRDYFKNTLKPDMDKGATVMLSTNFTASGHIVMLTAVDENGIRINDPYGMRLTKGYVYNAIDGKAGDRTHTDLIAADQATVATRLSHNSELKDWAANPEKLKDEPCDHWGQDNYYTFDELEANTTTWQVGKWNSVLEKKQ